MRTRCLLCSCLLLTLAVGSVGCHWQGPSRAELDGLVPGPTPNRVLTMNVGTVVTDIPADGRELKLWIPLPVSDGHQKVSDIEIKTALRPMVRYEAVHGSAMVFLSGDGPLPATLTASVSCHLEMHRCNALGASQATEGSSPPAESPAAPCHGHIARRYPVEVNVSSRDMARWFSTRFG